MKYRNNVFQRAMLLKLVSLQRNKQQDGGFVFVVVIAMTLILTSLFAVYSLLSKTETLSTKASINSNTGFYAAEAGLNLRAKLIQDKFVGYNRPEGTSPNSLEDCINNTGSQGTIDFACTRQTFNDQNLFTYVIEAANNPNSITISPGEPFAGLNAQEYRYDVNSVAVSSQNLPTAMLGMRFKSRLVPLFQFVMFYNNDLDFSIPPDITLNGAIHTNGNLYLDASASGPSTLSINGQVSTSGILYRGAKDTNTCTGIVKIYDPTTARTLNCSGTTRTTYNQSGVSSWNNMIQIGINQLTVPAPDTLDPTPGKLYWDKADLRLVLKLDSSGNPNSIEVRNQDNSVNTTANNSLRDSCSPISPTTTLPISTALVNEGIGDSNYEGTDTVLKVASAAGFTTRDVVKVGLDSDSNVIAAVNTTATPNTITLKRQLGHPYQPTIVASTGAIVRKAVVSTSDTFYNYREKNWSVGASGRFIRMLNVDVQGLLDCAHSLNLMGKALNDNSDGGLVWFLTVEGPNSAPNLTPGAGGSPNNYGVRIYNGDYLYSSLSTAPEIKGLTIVSDQATYIQGDYNKKDNPVTPTNEGDDPATPSIIEKKRPAAILSDTINVLSNFWKTDDSNNIGYDASNLPSTPVLLTDTIRKATETTINAAFLAGTNITTVNLTSGGVNNYPRFHEDWASIPFNYKGSFVSLNVPRRVNSPFCGSGVTCNIYTAPKRLWDYDIDFENAANLPPLTPRFVYLRQEVFSRDFER